MTASPTRFPSPSTGSGHASALLTIEGLGMDFGGVTALDGLSFKVPAGGIYAVIGPNGAGKTTLFNIVSGLYRPSRGRINLAGEPITGRKPHELARRGLSRTFQNLQIFFRMTALENVMVGRHLQEGRNVLAHLLGLPAVQRQNRETEAAARVLLAEVGLGANADLPAGSLAYGALKRLEIARALATQPKLLLLDEPAAGCNAVETQAIAGLIADIARRGVTVMLVEHDMRLVMSISDQVLVLDQGRRLAEGRPADVRVDPDVIRAYLGDHGAREAAHGQG